MPAAKLTSKGQITIPRDVREQLGLRTGDILDFTPTGKECRVRKRPSASRLDKWVGHLRTLRGRRTDELIEALRGR